jgi:large subunit ribosomal protein L19
MDVLSDVGATPTSPIKNVKNMSDDIRNSLKSGMIVKVHQKIKETNRKGEEKERVQIFEGIIINIKHGNEAGSTITVRKISGGIGVEKIFPVYSPIVENIELVRQMRVKQAKAGFIRTYKKKLREVKKKVPVEKTTKK